MAAGNSQRQRTGPLAWALAQGGRAARWRLGLIRRSFVVTNPMLCRVICSLASLALLAALANTASVTHSQSGRQKPSPTPGTGNTRPRQASKPNNTSAKQANTRPSVDANTAPTTQTNSDDVPEIVRISSTLVPVPATVVDNRGVAMTNLSLEDFELRIDGQPIQISEITRAETPVRMAMLFDNSGSLTESREFEKRAAVRFFRNVLRPMDQAAVFSVSTDVILAEPLTNDINRLELTVEGFGKPEGATSLFDAIIHAGTYLKPYSGRRIIVIVSDGEDTTSRADFDTTMQKALADDCQIYVVQTGLHDNANLRALAAERRMQEFASQTGGAVYIPKSAVELDDAFAQIAADLAQQYILSYYPAEDKRDGHYHIIAVSVKKRPNARVRSRKGFVVKSRDRV